MRLFLDAHVSGKRIGRALRQAGHDVRAADNPALEGWEDRDLFELAASEDRIVITFNVSDFLPLAQEWHAAGRNYAGLILVPSSISHEHFGVIIARVNALLSGTTQAQWQNRTDWVQRTQ